AQFNQIFYQNTVTVNFGATPPTFTSETYPNNADMMTFTFSSATSTFNMYQNGTIGIYPAGSALVFTTGQNFVSTLFGVATPTPFTAFFRISVLNDQGVFLSLSPSVTYNMMQNV
ncbi:MAG: hypothetical protein WB421_13895, partial [Terriglobales bacterium]